MPLALRRALNTEAEWSSGSDGRGSDRCWPERPLLLPFLECLRASLLLLLLLELLLELWRRPCR